MLCILPSGTLYACGDPNGIRTRVTAVKGRCPRPLDDRVKRPPNIGIDHSPRKANCRYGLRNCRRHVRHSVGLVLWRACRYRSLLNKIENGVGGSRATSTLAQRLVERGRETIN